VGRAAFPGRLGAILLPLLTAVLWAVLWAGIGTGLSADELTADATPARRIVTLAPHLAELVYDAGAGDRLVGVVAHSDYPPAVLELPRIGDAFAFNREAIVALAPDLVLGWVGFTPPEQVRRLRADGHRVVVLGADRPETVADALLEIGRLAGTESTARPRAEEYRAGLHGLRARYGDRRPVRVFVQLSSRPLYTVSDRQMIGRIVGLCGGRNVFGDAAGLTPIVSTEAVLAADPEVVLATAGESDEDPFAEWRRFPGMDATAAGRFHRLQADWITRPSLRLVLGAQEVCGYLDQAREAG
jgi:iron complex transport system substrate-binding protein